MQTSSSHTPGADLAARMQRIQKASAGLWVEAAGLDELVDTGAAMSKRVAASATDNNNVVEDLTKALAR